MSSPSFDSRVMLGGGCKRVKEREIAMTNLPPEFQNLSVPERIALAQALWDSIASQTQPPLSKAKRAELVKRAAEDDARPDDVVPWEKAKAEILARLGQS